MVNSIDYLPFELKIMIFERLDIQDLLHIRTVSKSWQAIVDFDVRLKKLVLLDYSSGYAHERYHYYTPIEANDLLDVSGLVDRSSIGKLFSKCMFKYLKYLNVSLPFDFDIGTLNQLKKLEQLDINDCKITNAAKLALPCLKVLKILPFVSDRNRTKDAFVTINCPALRVLCCNAYLNDLIKIAHPETVTELEIIFTNEPMPDLELLGFVNLEIFRNHGNHSEDIISRLPATVKELHISYNIKITPRDLHVQANLEREAVTEQIFALNFDEQSSEDQPMDEYEESSEEESEEAANVNTFALQLIEDLTNLLRQRTNRDQSFKIYFVGLPIQGGGQFEEDDFRHFRLQSLYLTHFEQLAVLPFYKDVSYDNFISCGKIPPEFCDKFCNVQIIRIIRFYKNLLNEKQRLIDVLSSAKNLLHLDVVNLDVDQAFFTNLQFVCPSLAILQIIHDKTEIDFEFVSKFAKLYEFYTNQQTALNSASDAFKSCKYLKYFKVNHHQTKTYICKESKGSYSFLRWKNKLIDLPKNLGHLPPNCMAIAESLFVVNERNVNLNKMYELCFDTTAIREDDIEEPMVKKQKLS